MNKPQMPTTNANRTQQQRGKPLPAALRRRVIDMLHDGHTPTQISQNLRVSRQTVYRYQRAAEQQQRRVPLPKPQGGYRWSKLNRRTIVALVRLLLQHPKSTLDELRRLAGRKGVLQKPLPSTTTIWRAMKKAGVRFGRASFFDPKTRTEPLIVLERRLFREAQRRDPLFAADRLLFFDKPTSTCMTSSATPGVRLLLPYPAPRAKA